MRATVEAVQPPGIIEVELVQRPTASPPFVLRPVGLVPEILSGHFTGIVSVCPRFVTGSYTHLG